LSRAILIILAVCTWAAVQERPPVKCTEDSPERRGEEGCTILANRPLVRSRTKPVYWHIDRFDSLEAAKNAAGANGVAAVAHGSVWLMTIEARTKKHHGGRHVAWIGPLLLSQANRYSMRVHSSLLSPGGTTPAHAHSGPEVVYVVDGEQCMETPKAAHRLGVGQALVLPTGTIHRGRVTGSGARRAFGLVLYVPGQPASRDLNEAPKLVACK
jgi:quercetin dioxygenase-like cupin family protein